VVINHPNMPKPAEEVAAQIKAKGGNAIALSADVSSGNEVVAMFHDVISRYGTVDILVANAGLQRDAALTKMSLRSYSFRRNASMRSVRSSTPYKCGKLVTSEPT
jgi:glucose 1-dehydrogenase